MLVFLLVGLLPLFLFVLAMDTGIIRTAGSSQNIKKFLADSNIYSSAVSSVLEQTKTTAGEAGEGISLTDPMVKQVAEKTFTPQFLQSNTEKVLDSFFVWLDGQAPIPDFRIDLSGLKDTFANEAAKAATERAATLPACTNSAPAQDFDPFSATCLPKGMSPASITDLVKKSISSGGEFLKDPVITAETIKLSGSNQSVFADQLKDVPDYYQQVKKTPLYLAILSLLTALAIVFLSASRTRGLRRLGITLITVGVLLLTLAYVLNWSVNKKLVPQLNMESKVIQETITTLAADITANINQTYYTFSGLYAGLGVLAIAVPMFIHRRSGHLVHEHAAKEHEASAAKEAQEPELKPKPTRKPPVKIQ
ncbi:hypothetical protein HYW35_02500 [Candidatus Saccharibacteria bacterium]|nr:hypothetical protein [Candidatus Saccharibacteria bacterium]